MFRPIALAARERQHLLSEMAQVRGLIPLIMKRRNQLPWTASERAELRTHIRRLSSMSPYLMCFACPAVSRCYRRSPGGSTGGAGG